MDEHSDSELRLRAEEYLRQPRLLDRIVRDIQSAGVTGEETLLAGIYLIGTSRLLPHPLAGLVTGASSAGKSFAIATVSRFFPPDAVIAAHYISRRAFLYFKPGRLRHRFVVAGERSRAADDEMAELTRLWRELVSGGRVTSAVPVPGKDGGWTTEATTQEGPIAYVESTTLSAQQIFPEDRTRFLLLEADESAEQSRRIVREYAERMKGGAATPMQIEPGLLALHRKIQEVIRPGSPLAPRAAEVVIPFADKIADAFPTSRVEVRRVFQRFLTLIETHALLCQYRRKWDAEGRIIADVEDYRLVRERFANAVAQGLGSGLPRSAPDVLAAIRKHCSAHSKPYFTIPAVEGGASYSRNTVRSCVHALVESGHVELLHEGHGNQATLYKLVGSDKPLVCLELPELPELPEL